MPSIILNKRTRTIKVVNQRETIKVVNRRERLQLRHAGLKGPKGDKGDQGETGPTGPTGESTFVREHHAADANVARPNALYVEWVGSVAPLNATTEDTWVQTP